MRARNLALAVVLAAVGFGPAALAETRTTAVLLVHPSGLQLQSGPGQPMPLQPPTLAGAPIGTGMQFPPLRIPARPWQYLGVPVGPAPQPLTLPPGAFRRAAQGPQTLGVAPWHAVTLQVRTNLSFSAPAPSFGSARFETGGRTGAATATFTDPGGAGFIRYTKTLSQFGGPAPVGIAAATPVLRWAKSPNLSIPCKHTSLGGPDKACIAVVLESRPPLQAGPGAPVGFSTTTPGLPAPDNVRGVHVPGTSGLVASSMVLLAAATTDALKILGFPWTTGRVTVAQPSARGGSERFTITGRSTRNSQGQGTLALVSGALAHRSGTGPRAQRGWMRLNLPEPAPALGAATALAALLALRALRSRRRG